MRSLLIVLLVVLNSACSVIEYSTLYEADVDFSKYKTFNVLLFAEDGAFDNENSIISTANLPQIRKSFTSQAELRGLVFKEHKPDIYILYSICDDYNKAYKNRRRYSSGDIMWYRSLRGFQMFGMKFNRANEDVIPPDPHIGQLKLMFVDRKSKKIIWVGEAEGERSDSPEEAEKRINTITKNLFEQCPYPIK
ncbi:DUF4136 domain-containing protein [Carboxylicivirga marina]|uniref:DUF4136 domain-containing protein n=1 Tax=Carboxylicivirga marina TaxID=2800988 RepID=A0ABS1HKJ2_9BACT|nr:DUF4136 domain-containing protein [Carboxylicivirga marina]MBK3517798.1 DUF4136 domain-containing protein [Carboxylicivirga marina]